MIDSFNKLQQFLIDRGETPEIMQLTPDASTREYFRIRWKSVSAIACVYPESCLAAEHNYLDVTNLFIVADLPVAKVFAYDEHLGIIVQEDLGNNVLRDVIVNSNSEEREKLVDDAISLIPKIQAATRTAFELNSIACRLRFDREKFLFELNFFAKHYFDTYKKRSLDAAQHVEITREFSELAEELESKAAVLCHRDFHAANLMIDNAGRLRIIDHQDARIGSLAYDLVSLLLDRVTEAPSAEWLADKRKFFLYEREKLGLAKISEDVFADEFRLQTVQRCLKAIGTFSFQSTVRGKTYFIPFIKPMFEITLRALENLNRFPMLRKIINEQMPEPAT